MATTESINPDIEDISLRLETLLSKITTGHTSRDANKLSLFSKLLIETSCAVLSCKNTLAPINCLPVEILSVIFALASVRPVVSGFPDVPSISLHSSQVLEERIMPVCRFWREVAISSGFLWSDICMSTKRKVAFRIHARRSQSALLNVHCDSDINDLPYLLEDHGHRIRLLQARAHSYSSTEALREVLQALPSAASSIEALALSAAQWPNMRSSSVSILGSAPRLRKLSLYHSPFTISDQLPNLTELFFFTPKRISYFGLLTLLSGAPRLEYVYIRARLEGSAVPAANSRTVTLAHLRRISLFLFTDPGHLVSRLVLPPACLIRLEHIQAHEVSASLAVLEQHLDPAHLERLSFSFGGGPDSHPNMEILVISLCDATNSKGIILELYRTPGPMDHLSTNTVIAQIFADSPLYANVREFTIKARRDLVDVNLLSSLPSLTTINHVFDRFTLRKPRGNEWEPTRVPVLTRRARDGTLPCPALKTLYFIQCGEEDLHDAREILEVRRQLGYPVTRLGIDCGVSLAKKANTLRELVDEFDLAYYDVHAYEDWRPGVSAKGMQWKTHSGRARFHWPEWPELTFQF